VIMRRVKVSGMRWKHFTSNPNLQTLMFSKLLRYRLC
jgi:hypothetical protein